MSTLVAHLRDLPPVTKLAGAAYTCLSAVAILLRYRAGWAAGSGDGAAAAAAADPARFLVLRPGFLLSYPWTVATSPLTEPNPLFVVCGLTVLATVGCFLERQWGGRSYAAFLAVTAAVPGLVATAAVLLLYLVRSRPDLLYT
ncbi:hypothetical protein H4R19_001916, partial [Coemansia spiralis]